MTHAFLMKGRVNPLINEIFSILSLNGVQLVVLDCFADIEKMIVCIGRYIDLFNQCFDKLDTAR